MGTASCMGTDCKGQIRNMAERGSRGCEGILRVETQFLRPDVPLARP